VRVEGAQYLGTYTDVAAGTGPAKTVRIELYRGELIGNPAARAEIRELVWFGEEDDRAQLAPSLVNRILPDLIAREILPWQNARSAEQPAGSQTENPRGGSPA
jgi:hypothetical protein